MVFDVSTLGYIQNTQSIILDYAINIKNLRRNDQMFDAGALGNFSLAGFEMVILTMSGNFKEKINSARNLTRFTVVFLLFYQL